MSQKILREDILPPDTYSKNRNEVNAEVIKKIKLRRLTTKTFSFLFEDKDTVLNQINEMVFLENIKDEEEIDRLIEVYSEQLPGDSELSVSMFIEFEDENQMVKELPRLAGIEQSVYLTFDGNELRGIPEEGRSTEVLESTLQYLKFQFTSSLLEKFLTSKNVYIETRHKTYQEIAKITPELLEQLKEELRQDH
ncbi:hypothetical protein IX51_06385 [uncultured archaeon]|nr:hypothetical protein IX51_06385 [uncultured archaeon]